MKVCKYLLFVVIVQITVSLHLKNKQHRMKSHQQKTLQIQHNKILHRELVDLATNFLYKNNLKNSNWYYGSINQTQYRVRLFVAGTKNNLTSCPYNQPYTKEDDRTSCFNCPNDAPVFNLGNSQCQNCPQGYYFLESLGNCTQGQITPISQTQTAPTTSVSPDQGLVALIKGQQQKPQKNVTQVNSNGTNTNTKKQQNTTSNSNATKNTTQTNTTQTSSNTTKKSYVYNCPYETPLQLEDGSCIACNQTQQYFQIDNICSQKVYRTNPQTANKLLLPSQDFLDNQAKTIENNHPNRIIYDCPADKPYLSGQNCISCQSTQLFDAQASKCVDGCTNYTIYDAKLKQCVQGHYLTNPQIGNLIFNVKDYNTWKSNIQQQKQDVPFAEYCPDESPFAVNGQCISCSGDEPYFNVDLQKCSGCEQGRSYDQGERTCLTYYDPSVSLGRSIMNILG